MYEEITNSLLVTNKVDGSTAACFVCNEHISGETISAELFQLSNDSLLNPTRYAHTLAQILDQPIESDACHSLIICNRCQKLCHNFDILKIQMNKIQQQLIGDFNQTLSNVMGNAVPIESPSLVPPPPSLSMSPSLSYQQQQQQQLQEEEETMILPQTSSLSTKNNIEFLNDSENNQHFIFSTESNTMTQPPIMIPAEYPNNVIKNNQQIELKTIKSTSQTPTMINNKNINLFKNQQNIQEFIIRGKKIVFVKQEYDSAIENKQFLPLQLNNTTNMTPTMTSDLVPMNRKPTITSTNKPTVEVLSSEPPTLLINGDGGENTDEDETILIDFDENFIGSGGGGVGDGSVTNDNNNQQQNYHQDNGNGEQYFENETFEDNNTENIVEEVNTGGDSDGVDAKSTIVTNNHDNLVYFNNNSVIGDGGEGGSGVDEYSLINKTIGDGGVELRQENDFELTNESISITPMFLKKGMKFLCQLCDTNGNVGISNADNLQYDDCKLMVYDSQSIVEHLKHDHNEEIFICNNCGHYFPNVDGLLNHLAENHDNKLENENGNDEEDGENDLDDDDIDEDDEEYDDDENKSSILINNTTNTEITNEKFTHKPKKYWCDLCQCKFENLKLYRIHKRIHYPTIKLWSCKDCNKKYSSKNLLDEHMNMHTGDRPYKCSHCNKDFASKYTLTAHLKIHSERKRPHACDTCPKSFYSQQNLIQHKRTHTGVKEYMCTICNKAFGTAHNLDVHKIVHTGYKPFICRTCGKAFARRAEIKDHERTHTGERPYSCNLCSASFAQRSNLMSHKRATHLNDKRYKCELCEKSFKRRRLLDYHKKAMHTGERPYKCDICKATFVYPEHYKKHLRIHTGVKPYVCEICNKAFTSRDNRNAHRYVHSDKKPYECLFCGRGFMRKPLLIAHMQAENHGSDKILFNQPNIKSERDGGGGGGAGDGDNDGGSMEVDGSNSSRGEEDGTETIALMESNVVYIDDENIFQINEEQIFIKEEDTLVDPDNNIEEHLIIDGQVHFGDYDDDNNDENNDGVDDGIIDEDNEYDGSTLGRIEEEEEVESFTKNILMNNSDFNYGNNSKPIIYKKTNLR